MGLNEIVEKLQFGSCVKIYIAVNSGHTPKVLVFEITPVTPLIHLHRHRILAFVQVFCNIKSSRQAAVFAISHIFSVDPNIQGTFNAIELQKNLSPTPIFRHLK